MEWKTEFLVPGMILEEAAYTENGSDFAPYLIAGKKLTEQDIRRLKEKEIENVIIEVKEETFFDTFRDYVRTTIDPYNVMNVLQVAPVFEYIAEKTSDFKFDMTRFLNEDYEFKKNDVNIACMSVALATKYNKMVAAADRIDIQRMASIALLSNVGCRAKIPQVLNKLREDHKSMLPNYIPMYPNLPKDVLDKYNPAFIPFYSYLILKGTFKFSEAELTAVLIKKEKEKDKSGLLGRNLGKDNPNDLSVKMGKILRICTYYNNLLYKSKIQNVEQPFGKMNTYLDTMVAHGLSDVYWTKMIKQVVPVYPLGEKVELSDGTIGIVAEQNSLDITNPKVVDLEGNEVPISKSDGLVIMALYNDPNKKTSSMQMSARG